MVVVVMGTSPGGRKRGNFVELPVQLSTKTVDLRSVAVNLIYLKGFTWERGPCSLEEKWWDRISMVFVGFFFAKTVHVLNPCTKRERNTKRSLYF